MTSRNKIALFSLITGISTGTIGILFLDVILIYGIIAGILSGVFVFILLSKINKSNKYPYWKINKNGGKINGNNK